MRHAIDPKNQLRIQNPITQRKPQPADPFLMRFGGRAGLWEDSNSAKEAVG